MFRQICSVYFPYRSSYVLSIFHLCSIYSLQLCLCSISGYQFPRSPTKNPFHWSSCALWNPISFVVWGPAEFLNLILQIWKVLPSPHFSNAIFKRLGKAFQICKIKFKKSAIYAPSVFHLCSVYIPIGILDQSQRIKRCKGHHFGSEKRTPNLRSFDPLFLMSFLSLA